MNLLARIEALPGVESTALSQPLPVTSGSYPVRLGVSGDDHDVEAERALVSDAFFSTVQIPVIAGGAFRRTDGPQGVPTAMLSESAARALFGQAAPIGRTVRVGSTPSLQQLEVIAVVPDALLRGTRQENPRTVYLNYWQADAMSQGYPSLVVRTKGIRERLSKALIAPCGTAVVNIHSRFERSSTSEINRWRRNGSWRSFPRRSP